MDSILPKTQRLSSCLPIEITYSATSASLPGLTRRCTGSFLSKCVMLDPRISSARSKYCIHRPESDHETQERWQSQSSSGDEGGAKSSVIVAVPSHVGAKDLADHQKDIGGGGRGR